MGYVGQPSMNKNYKECFDRGDKYENFVYPILREEWGVNMIPHKTQSTQLKGENSFGVEIKFDEKSIKSPNLFIEYKERREKDDGTLSTWEWSGIYRGDYFEDNSWLYLIGNYDIFYIFLKKRLKDLHSSNKYYEARGKTVDGNETSMGFLLPKIEAKTLALDVINITNASNKSEQLDFDYLKPIPDHG